MKIWSSDALSDAHLNATFAPEAIVDASLSATNGAYYKDIADALAAGHRHIQVNAGNYASDTLTISSSHDGARIVGASMPIDNGSTLTGGVRHGAISITTASNVTLENIGTSVGGNGFHVASGAAHVKLIRCAAWGASGQGFRIESSEDVELFGCIAAENDNGFLITPASTSAHMSAVRLVSCWAYQNDGNGFSCPGAAGVDTGTERLVTFLGCVARDNCEEWAAAGISISGDMSALVEACQVYNNGHSTPSEILGNGIRVDTPLAGTNMTTQLIGNWCRSNRGAGISLGSVSNRVIIDGNVCKGNTYGNYVNCTSSPGYNGRGLSIPGTNLDI